MLEGLIGKDYPDFSRITYGEVPIGFQEIKPAVPLERPGCYVAVISGLGVVGFRIDSSGGIAEMSEQEMREMYRSGRGDSTP
jgi:hypothetical protein